MDGQRETRDPGGERGLGGARSRGLHRRQLLAAGGVAFSACAARTSVRAPGHARLDLLLAAHADALPENAGGGANHYPMAAEALEALGFAEEIDDAWIEGAALYAGESERVRPLGNAAERAAALGRYDRLGDWLDHFRDALASAPWQAVVSEWAPTLAPGLCAAAYHGVIRTGHAVRALEQRDTTDRRRELALGLAYWAARYVELQTTPEEAPSGGELQDRLAGLESPWLDDRSDVDFFAVSERLCLRPIAPPIRHEATGSPARAELHGIVRSAATAFLEMLVLERHRIWLLHTVTGPAALDWLLPLVDERGARVLVAYAHQSVLAMYTAFGEPFAPRAHVRAAPAPWPELIQRAVESRSVHGIKLIDALHRFDHDGDPLWRSVAEEWFLWT